LTDSGDVAKSQPKSLQSAENSALAAELTRARDALSEVENAKTEARLQYEREIEHLHASLDQAHDQMQVGCCRVNSTSSMGSLLFDTD
jgi:phosphoglycerate-specific signal transduction histidine kinase